MKRQLSSVGLGLSLVLLSSQAWALFGTEELERRIIRLEQAQSSSSQSDMVIQLERLRSEVQQLRGELEIQSHALDALKRRQEDLYSDLDRRLGGTGGAVPGGAASTASEPAPLSVDNSPRMPAGSLEQPQPEGLTPMAAQSQAPDAHQEAAYSTAFGQMKAAKYRMAAQSFRGYLSAYPNGAYAADAQYWLGEAEYMDRNYDRAKVELEKVLRQFPNSPKVSMARKRLDVLKQEGH